MMEDQTNQTEADEDFIFKKAQQTVGITLKEYTCVCVHACVCVCYVLYAIESALIPGEFLMNE